MNANLYTASCEVNKVPDGRTKWFPDVGCRASAWQIWESQNNTVRNGAPSGNRGERGVGRGDGHYSAVADNER